MHRWHEISGESVVMASVAKLDTSVSFIGDKLELKVYGFNDKVVKLHSISLKGPEEKGPKTVKLFSNKEHMGFMYRISYSCFISQELSVSNVSSVCIRTTFFILTVVAFYCVGKPVALTYVKFQNVRSVTIFIEDNQSKGHVNKVQKIAFFGSTVETTDMKGLKKIEDH
ncbi:PITH domain-containing protein At3g04780 [Linum perenne]